MAKHSDGRNHPNFLASVWQIVNWEKVAERYTAAKLL